MAIPATRQIKARLLIGRPDGQTWEDVSEFLRHAEVSFGIDGETVRQLSFDLIGASFGPRDKASQWNVFEGQYAPLLWPNREVVLDVATPAIGENPVWRRLFHGYLGDDITVDGGMVSCLCRDLAKRLQDCYIEELRTYGSEEGTPAENVIQAIIDDNLGAGKVSLYCPVSPGFMVKPYEVEYRSVWDAIKEVAAQIGWYLGYLWDEQTNEYRLTLMEPPRDKDTADFAFDYEDDIYVQELSIDDADIRNVVRVTYQDAATRQRSTVLVEDLASIAEYGRRAMQIEEGDASLIDSEQEALALANAALADLKDLTATTQITLPLFPEVSIFDGIAVQNPRTSSTVDFYGVESVRHILDFDGGLFRTELVAAGRVVGSHKQWLEMETRPGAPGLPPGPPTTNQEPPTLTGLQAKATFNGVELRFNPVASPYLDAYEIEHYVEPETEWRLLASGKDTYYRFEFPAHSVVHLRVRARFYTGAVGPWSTTLVVSPRGLTEEEMGGASFAISVSSDPQPLTGELESLWDMDESTGVTFPSGPVTITFKYPVQQGTDMARIHLGGATTGYFQMLDGETWVDILGSETEPINLEAGWNVKRLSKFYYGQEYRVVINDPVQVNELKFWRVTLADEILAQKMNLTGDLAISAGEGAVVMDSKGLRGYKEGQKTFEIDAETGDARFAGDISGASGTFGNGSIYLGEGGLRAEKNGNTTFEIDSDGNAYFSGEISAASILSNSLLLSALTDFNWVTASNEVTAGSSWSTIPDMTLQVTVDSPTVLFIIANSGAVGGVYYAIYGGSLLTAWAYAEVRLRVNGSVRVTSYTSPHAAPIFHIESVNPGTHTIQMEWRKESGGAASVQVGTGYRGIYVLKLRR